MSVPRRSIYNCSLAFLMKGSDDRTLSSMIGSILFTPQSVKRRTILVLFLLVLMLLVWLFILTWNCSLVSPVYCWLHFTVDQVAYVFGLTSYRLLDVEGFTITTAGD